MAVPHGIDRSGAAGGSGAQGMSGLLNDLADPNRDALVFWDESAGGFEWTTDPGADRILFWDESEDAFGYLTVGSGLSLSGTTLSASGGIAASILDAKGDIIVATAADTAARLSIGAAGTIPMARSAETTGIAYVAAINKAVHCLVQSNDVGDTANDVNITAGGAIDSTGAYWITLGAEITKRIDAAWAVGDDQGGLDGTESVAGTPDVSTWYYVWLIARSDTGVVDVLFSESATAPTMPTNYDFRRLIGAVLNNSSGDVDQFTAYEVEGGGLEVLWTTPVLDIDLSNTLTTSRRTDAIRVPLSFSTIGHINYTLTDAAALYRVWIYCPDQADSAPSGSAAPRLGRGFQAPALDVEQPAVEYAAQVAVLPAAVGEVGLPMRTLAVE